MSPQRLKRVLAEEGLKGNHTPSKWPRTSKVTRPVVTKDAVPNVKSEDMTEDTITCTLLKNPSALSPRDLPPECLYRFRVAFRPAIRDLVGTLGPWESPADADIVHLWDSCFPKHKIEASEGLRSIVFKLVENTVRYWRREIANRAAEYLRMNLMSSSDRQGERVARAAWLLGDDEKDRKRPFYYKKYQNGVQPSGMFQSPIIAATLATHLWSISCLPKDSRLQRYPTGALALSILAVKRALTWAKTGVDSIPRTLEGHFSRANWGDHYRLENGQYVLTKTASNIVVVIGKLRDTQWERILAEARKYTTEKDAPTVSKIPPKEEAEGQSDFELEDWDDDFE